MFNQKVLGALGAGGCFMAGLNLNFFSRSSDDSEETGKKPKRIKFFKGRDKLPKRHHLLVDGHKPISRKVLIDGYDLKLVQIMIRHGARTPIHTIKNLKEVSYNSSIFVGDVPHTTYNYKIVNLEGGTRPESTYDQTYARKERLLKDGARRGYLTKLGQDQMFVIGRSLRKLYVEDAKFLDEEFNPDQIYVRSTNIGRTIATARCILGGMYGYEQLKTRKEPVYIHVEDSKKDALLPRTNVCRVLRQINHYAMVHGGDLPGLKEDRIHLEKVLGISPNVQKKLNFIDVRDDMVAREAHGYSYPKELVPYRPMIEENATKVMYYAFCAHLESEREVAMRLSTGPLIKLVIDNMENVDKNPTKMYIYSCHDSTLVGLLGSLDIFDFKWPPFGARVVMELYENKEGKRFVRVSYNGKDKIIRGCKEELAPLEDFKTNMQPFVIDEKEYKDVCSSDILEKIAQEVLAQEKGEVEDSEDQERSDTPAGM